jgi:hypothetical protein
MAHFQTKNPNLGEFWRVLRKNMLVYFMGIWSILLPFRILVAIWYILWMFSIYFPVLVSCSKKNLATPNLALHKSRIGPKNDLITS